MASEDDSYIEQNFGDRAGTLRRPLIIKSAAEISSKIANRDNSRLGLVLIVLAQVVIDCL